MKKPGSHLRLSEECSCLPDKIAQGFGEEQSYLFGDRTLTTPDIVKSLGSSRSSMSEFHFRHDPIIEAIVNLAVEPGAVSMDQIQTIAPLVADSYPHSNALFEFKAEILPGTDAPEPIAAQHQIGLQYRSVNERQVFQARINGFSFHRLAPYDRWTTFKSDALKLWEVYAEVTGHPRVAFYTLRYINRFSIPLDEPIHKYFNVYPEVKGDLPQKANTFVMRLELPIPEAAAGSLLILQQNLAPSLEPGHVYVVLDNEFRFPAGSDVSDEELWASIEAARDIKNKTFLNCITSTLRDIIS